MLGFLIRALALLATLPLRQTNAQDQGGPATNAGLAEAIGAVYRALASVYRALEETIRGLIAPLARVLYAGQLATAQALGQIVAALRWVIVVLVPAAVRYALGVVDQRAAAGYNAGRARRRDILRRAAAAITSDDPAVKELVDRAVGLALDLAEADNPLLRLALGFVLKELAGKLGIDKVAGDLLAALIGGHGHGGEPRGLGDVISRISGRLDALEQQWVTFMDNGGPELYQAGRDWKELSSPAFTAALLGFVAEAIRDPEGTARATAETVEPIYGPVIGEFIGLIGRIAEE